MTRLFDRFFMSIIKYCLHSHYMSGPSVVQNIYMSIDITRIFMLFQEDVNNIKQQTTFQSISLYDV